MSRNPYKTYSREFKIEAVRLAEQSDKPVTQIARELGVRQNQIYKWKKQLETHSSKAFPGKGLPVDDETARLKRELAAGHLFERCYKHCVYITGDTGKGGYSAFRHACLKNALGERGLECDRFTSSGLTGPLCRMKKRPLRRELAKYLKSAPKPLAVICDDHIGYNVYETAQSLNLQIPQDVALLGIGNDPVLCALTDPPLTSIDVSFHELGCSAGRLSLHLLDNRAERYLSETIEPGEVVLRGTTAISAGNDPLVEKAVEYIAQHIHEPLNVDRLLLEMQVSHTNLKERFRRELNRTPLAEIHRQKLDCLKQELHGGSRTVGALARRYGFSSAEHMTRFFRRNTGMTPSEYRAASCDSDV